jgi:predicted nuclease of predicted toxin-antitoxin system
VRFLIDAQLPPALAATLTRMGHEAEHLMSHDLLAATDRQIWRLALETRATIVTKDEDFVILRRTLADGPPVIWLRFGNTTNRALLERLLPLLPEIVSAIEGGETLVEVR